jgi:hypothetical protein
MDASAMNGMENSLMALGCKAERESLLLSRRSMNSIFYCSRHLWPRSELSYLLLIIKSAVLGRIKVMDDLRADRLSRQALTSTPEQHLVLLS